jgi:predicted methyltransferase
MFLRITEFAHELLKEHVKEGDIVVDATMGNGLDTLLLANLVGENGKVVAYDVQAQAIESTRERLAAHRLLHRTELRQKSHAEMEMPNDICSAVVFNLGYLPGSDKIVKTLPETTIVALQKALVCIKVGGIIVMVVYPGHPEGKEEKVALESYIETLPYPKYRVLKYQYVNVQNYPPFIYGIEKRQL